VCLNNAYVIYKYSNQIEISCHDFAMLVAEELYPMPKREDEHVLLNVSPKRLDCKVCKIYDNKRK